MKKVFAFIKFSFAFVLIAAIVVSFALSFEATLPVVLAGIVVTAYVGTYSFYLVRTGIWNLNNQNYSVKPLALIGLLFHFFSMSYFLTSSLNTFTSKTESIKLFYTALPFFISGVGFGVYDSIKFYTGWKCSREVKV
jgi:hypothetical protein